MTEEELELSQDFHFWSLMKFVFPSIFTFVFLAVFSVIISAVSAIIVYFVNKNKISLLEERIEVLEKGKKKNEK